MKALKMVMVVLIGVAIILPAMVVKEAKAAATYANCWVNYAGANPAGGNKIVKLTNSDGTVPAINGTAFILSATDANVMLSTALTAMASGMKVRVHVSDTTVGSTCNMMLLLDQ